MKTVNILILLVVFSLISCNKTEKTAVTEKTVAKTDLKAVEKEVTQLVKDMYRWVEKTDASGSFRPFVKDSMIVGLDHIGQSLYIKQLDESGYFTKGFIDNMGRIFNKQDELLRSGKAEWHDGKLPPFGEPEVDPWCNCQDGDLNDITLHFQKTTTDTAAFYLNWESYEDPGWAAHHYSMVVVKENGKWKIDWMEGWDYEANTKI